MSLAVDGADERNELADEPLLGRLPEAGALRPIPVTGAAGWGKQAAGVSSPPYGAAANNPRRPPNGTREGLSKARRGWASPPASCLGHLANAQCGVREVAVVSEVGMHALDRMAVPLNALGTPRQGLSPTA